MSCAAVRPYIPVRSFTDDAALKRIDHLFDGKRIIFLGEPAHYLHEKYPYRLLFITHLFHRGIYRIGMEIGRSDAGRIDRYLESGDEKWLEQVALYGYRGDDRSDRPSSVSGRLFHRNADGVARFRAEEFRFFRALRVLSEARRRGSHRLQFFGYDVDVHSGGAYRDIRELLSPFSAHSTIHEFEERMRRVEGESVAQEIDRLERVREYLNQNRAALKGESDVATIRAVESDLRCLTESLAFTRVANTNPTTPDLIEAFRIREQTMFWQMDEALEARGDIVLMGHNSHLTRDDHQFSDIPSLLEWRWPRIGTYLANKVPVLAIWMLYGSGAHSDLQLCKQETCPVAETEIGRYLGAVGYDFLLPTGRDDFLDRMQNYPINGQVARGRLSRAADVIFFVRQVSGLREN